MRTYRAQAETLMNPFTIYNGERIVSKPQSDSIKSTLCTFAVRFLQNQFVMLGLFLEGLPPTSLQLAIALGLRSTC